MKILMVCAGFPPHQHGGTEVHAEQLARTLTELDHEVSVFCRGDREDLSEYATYDESFGAIAVQRIVHRFGDTRSMSDLLSVPAIDAAFGARLDADPPDVVHVHHLTGLSGGIVRACRDRAIPVVLTLHDFWFACPRGQRITPDLDLCDTLDRDRCTPCLQKLWPHFGIERQTLDQHDAAVKELLNACDRLITPSTFHRWKMLELDLDPDRVIAIPHGLDKDLVPARESISFPPKRIGFIGGVLPSKGVHVLVDAMNRLGNVNLECHVYGEVQPFHGDLGYGERLQEQARDDLNFFFHGTYAQEDLPRILGELDVVVVPSLWYESFCLTIREAMLAGVPVLASDLGAMHEALADLGLDLLFEAGNGQDLAWKLHALATDEERYGKAASLRGQVRDLRQMAADYEALYGELGGARERRRLHAVQLAERKRKGTERPYASVFIPTWNGGPRFHQVLERVLSQQTSFDYEVICIDSGSKDGTLEFLKQQEHVRLIEIPNSEFNHGLTRNRGVKEARGEIVALLTQDALPIDEHWLESLVSNFDDPDVAGAYCHQIPLPDCNPWQADRLRGWTRGEGTPERKTLLDRKSWEHLHPWDRYRLIAFDDVASCVRKSVMEEVPFARRQFGEDVDWARRAILSGRTLIMDPRSVVEHSHDNPIWYEFKRVYLDHDNLHDLVGLQTVPSLYHVLRNTGAGTWHLWRQVWRDPRPLTYKAPYLFKTPFYSFTQNLAQYLGAESRRTGKKGFFGWLDRKLRKGV